MKKHFKKLKSSVAVLLTAVLAVGSVPMRSYAAHDVMDEYLYETHEIFITDEQLEALEAIQEFNSVTGVVGFEGDFALPSDNSQVPVLVFFESNPAPTQVFEAAMDGMFLAFDDALQIVEDEHAIFRNELSNLFGVMARARMGGGYDISVEYRHAFNGVAMTLPADMVYAVAEIGVVRMIMPDYAMNPIGYIEDDAVITEELLEFLGAMAASADGNNPWGMMQGRARMNADQLHAEGIRGEGIIVAVVDGGIDWMHPTFTGAFPEASVINQARIDRFGPNGTAGHRPELTLPLWDGTVTAHNPGGYNELFNINRYTSGSNIGFERAGAPEYVFLGRDTMRLWPGGNGRDLRGQPVQPGWTFANGEWYWTYPPTMPAGMPGNNPFECSPLIYFRTNEQGQEINMRAYLNLVGAVGGAVPGWSSHGTHVAGTILGRPYPAMDSPDFDPGRAIMGVAPGATLIHYRGLTGGSIYASVWIAAQEWAFKDGANVVNMSYGWQEASVMSLHHFGINQMMLADPTIIFVASAGNSGTNFSTGGNPGGGSMGITVSALAEPAPAITITSADFVGTAILPFPHVRNAARVDATDTARRVIPMPLTAGSPYGVASLATVPVGAGNAADFAALMTQYTPAQLEGAFILVRRGYTFDAVSSQANALGLAGVISINGDGQTLPGFTTATGANDTQPAPLMMMTFAQGLQWATALTTGTPRIGDFTITGRGFNPNASQDLPIVQPFSSRGPRETTFEISPDIGSQGVNVFSAVARWTAGGGGINPTPANGNTVWYDRGWDWAYGNMSGTSMSAPHMAGAVALIQHYSVQNAGGMWANYEIKTRIMNTATCLDYTGNIYSPFDAARNVDLVAATRTNTVVFVEYRERIPTMLYIDFDSPNQVRLDTRSGGLSFGGFNRGILDSNPRNIGNEQAVYGMVATIYNNSDAPIVYNISHRFVTGRPARPAGSNTASLDGGMLWHPTQITVQPGRNAQITFSLHIPAGEELGFYEGFVTITGGNEDIVLPFGAVVHAREGSFTFEGLYRPVVTTNTVAQGAHNVTSNELIMYFSQTWGFYADFYLIDRTAIHQNPEFRGDNWFTGGVHLQGFPDLKFADYILGSTMGSGYHYAGRFGRHFPHQRGLVDGTMRGVIFDGYFTPGIHEDPMVGRSEPVWLGDWLNDLDYDHSGEFYIGMTIFRKSPTRTGHWFFEQSLLVPFYVDNTPPIFNSLAVGDTSILFDNDAQTSIVTFDDTVVISGNIFDEWLNDAMANDVTFDVWTNAQSEVSIPENLALWVLVGENEDGNRPIRVTDIDEDGYFTFTWPTPLTLEEETPLSIWLIDGYAPVPVVNQVPIGVGDPDAPAAITATVNSFWMQPAVARILDANDYFEISEFMAVSDVANLRSDVLFGRAHSNNPAVFGLNAEQFEQFVWSGINVTEVNATITLFEAQFGLDMFNNGPNGSPSRPNAHLAQTGTIRIWTQLNGANATVPYAGLEVSAVLYPSNEDAMQFVSVNNMWANPGNVNLIDVDKANGAWQTIILTATFNGQAIELILDNALAATAATFGVDMFNNGQGGSPSRANAGLAAAGTIRIWTQLDGVNALVPFADLTITAEFAGGGDAMEFVRVNRIWNNLNYVNLIDVDRNANWTYINLYVSLAGQESILLLSNN